MQRNFTARNSTLCTVHYLRGFSCVSAIGESLDMAQESSHAAAGVRLCEVFIGGFTSGVRFVTGLRVWHTSTEVRRVSKNHIAQIEIQNVYPCNFLCSRHDGTDMLCVKEGLSSHKRQDKNTL